MRHVLLALGFVIVAATAAHATGEAVDGFPNWQERVMHEWTNRARSAPQTEMQMCGAACGEAACYTPQPPLPWMAELNHAARFHSDEQAAQGYFAHDSACTLVSNIDALYPASCTGAASCACVGGTKACSGTCTPWYQRVGMFGAGAMGEIIASGTDPNGAFYQWLYEPYGSTACGFTFQNGHRYNILTSGPAVGYGAGAGPSVGDFGGNAATAKIPSGSHYPRQAASVDAWANWYDTAAPHAALIDVDGTCHAMTLDRGTATNGAYHAAVTGVGSGCHRYYFVFKDATDTVVTYPSTGSLGIGPAGSCADWDTSRPELGTGCSAAPPSDDAGTGGPGDDAGTGSNAQNGDAGTLDEPMTGGCGCRTGSNATTASAALWLALTAFLARGRRRRRR